jgi:hypothetical protein
VEGLRNAWAIGKPSGAAAVLRGGGLSLPSRRCAPTPPRFEWGGASRQNTSTGFSSCFFFHNRAFIVPVAERVPRPALPGRRFQAGPCLLARGNAPVPDSKGWIDICRLITPIVNPTPAPGLSTGGLSGKRGARPGGRPSLLKRFLQGGGRPTIVQDWNCTGLDSVDANGPSLYVAPPAFTGSSLHCSADRHRSAAHAGVWAAPPREPPGAPFSHHARRPTNPGLPARAFS